MSHQQQSGTPGPGEEYDDKIRACAVCARILDYAQPMTDPGGEDVAESWVHSSGADHPAVPVLLDEVRVDGRCDFCEAANPQFEVPANDFVVPILDNEASRGSWAACVDCARLIQRDQWKKLTDRAVASHKAKYGSVPPGVLFALKALYLALRQNICGPVRPLVWPPIRSTG